MSSFKINCGSLNQKAKLKAFNFIEKVKFVSVFGNFGQEDNFFANKFRENDKFS